MGSWLKLGVSPHIFATHLCHEAPNPHVTLGVAFLVLVLDSLGCCYGEFTVIAP